MEPGPCDHLEWQCSDPIAVLVVWEVVTSIGKTFPHVPKFTKHIVQMGDPNLCHWTRGTRPPQLTRYNRTTSLAGISTGRLFKGSEQSSML